MKWRWKCRTSTQERNTGESRIVNARCVHGPLRWVVIKPHGDDPRRLREKEQKGMDMGTETLGGVSSADFTLSLETKAQNTATLLTPQCSCTCTHVEIQVLIGDLLYKNPIF